MEQIIKHFSDISEKAGKIHKLLDSGEYLEGKKARRYWTKEMRINQADLLSEMREAEYKAMELAEEIIK